MDNLVKVVLAERNAIYVNDTRITNRSTKWGARATLAIFECAPGEVVSEIRRRGFPDHLRCIDTEPYLSAAKEPTP